MVKCFEYEILFHFRYSDQISKLNQQHEKEMNDLKKELNDRLKSDDLSNVAEDLKRFLIHSNKICYPVIMQNCCTQRKALLSWT